MIFSDKPGQLTKLTPSPLEMIALILISRNNKSDWGVRIVLHAVPTHNALYGFTATSIARLHEKCYNYRPSWVTAVERTYYHEHR